MEFVSNNAEVSQLLNTYGIEEVDCGDSGKRLRMADSESAVHMHFANPDASTEPREGAQMTTISSGLGEFHDQILHRLNLTELLLIPTGKWRNVFDAVAFSLAENEAWQEIDAAATVELNTQDPLLCERADFPTLIDLINALMADAESAEQGFMVLSLASPVLIEIAPPGVIRVSVGNQALADEVAECVQG